MFRLGWSLTWKGLLDNGWFVRIVLVLRLVSAVLFFGRVELVVIFERWLMS